jgi:t-SNARE complex subunit (syntaxin)
MATNCQVIAQKQAVLKQNHCALLSAHRSMSAEQAAQTEAEKAAAAAAAAAARSSIAFWVIVFVVILVAGIAVCQSNVRLSHLVGQPQSK